MKDHTKLIGEKGTATLDGKMVRLDQVFDNFPVLAGCNGYITGVWRRTSETGEMDDKQAAEEIVMRDIND